MHLCLDAAPAVITAPSSPEGSDRSGVIRARLRSARWPWAVSGFPGLAFLRGRMIAAAPRAVMAAWQCQAGLDRRIAVVGRAATLARGLGFPGHLGIEPDRQRAVPLERFVVGRPVPGLVDGGCGSAHVLQLPRWIHEMNPSRDLCNRALIVQYRKVPISPLNKRLPLQPQSGSHQRASRALAIACRRK